jgi:hypothetical protein
MGRPVSAREITRRWISLVPSKMVVASSDSTEADYPTSGQEDHRSELIVDSQNACHFPAG